MKCKYRNSSIQYCYGCQDNNRNDFICKLEHNIRYGKGESTYRQWTKAFKECQVLQHITWGDAVTVWEDKR